MDTRTKIVDWPAAECTLRERAEKNPLKVVVGYFDPLLAAHAARLEEIAGAGKLIVLVASPARPLLPAKARAELVAALGVVEQVVIAPAAALQEMLRPVPVEALVLEQAADAARTTELIRRVHARQKA